MIKQDNIYYVPVKNTKIQIHKLEYKSCVESFIYICMNNVSVLVALDSNGTHIYYLFISKSSSYLLSTNREIVLIDTTAYIQNQCYLCVSGECVVERSNTSKYNFYVSEVLVHKLLTDRKLRQNLNLHTFGITCINDYIQYFGFMSANNTPQILGCYTLKNSDIVMDIFNSEQFSLDICLNENDKIAIYKPNNIIVANIDGNEHNIYFSQINIFVNKLNKEYIEIIEMVDFEFEYFSYVDNENGRLHNGNFKISMYCCFVVSDDKTKIIIYQYLPSLDQTYPRLCLEINDESGSFPKTKYLY